MTLNVSNKQEILDEISRLEKELKKTLSKINTFDAILTLLSYYEITINELSDNARKIEKEELYDKLQPVLIQRNQIQTLLLISEAIDHLLSNSNNRNELSKTPPIESVFTLSDYDSRIQKWLEKHYDPEVDWLYPIDIQLAGSLMAKRFICVQKFFEISNNHQIRGAFYFFEIFCRYKGLSLLIEHNIKAKLHENKWGFDLDELTVEDILEKEKTHPRTLDYAPHSFPMFKTEHVELGKKTLMSTNLKIDTPIQTNLRKQEIQSYYDEYLSLPNFPEKFKTKFGVSLKNYSEIIFAIRELAFKYDTAVCHYPKQRLIIKIRKMCKCSKKDINTVVDLLTNKNGDKSREKPLFSNGVDYFYCGSMISMPATALVDLVFDEYNDGNLQGLEFEKECRKILEKNSCIVFKDRLKIDKQMMSDKDSLNLLNRIKRGTDIDVIGWKNKFLFVLECKSELPRFKRRWTSQVNKFEKYYFELLYNTEWITRNYNEFVRLAKSKNCILPINIKSVIPILITSFVTTEKKEMLSITPSELDQVMKKIPDDLEGPKLEIVLKSNTIIEIPVFSKMN